VDRLIVRTIKTLALIPNLMRNNKKIKLKQEQKETLEKKEAEEEKKGDWRYAKSAIFINHKKTPSQNDRRTNK